MPMSSMLVRLVRLPTLPAGVHRSQTGVVVIGIVLVATVLVRFGLPLGRPAVRAAPAASAAASSHAVSTNELRR